MRLRFKVMALMASPALVAADAPAFIGMWGGGDATLAIDAQGGRLQLGCQLILFAPVRPDASGGFSAPARVETISTMLPEDDAADRPALPARLEGKLRAGGMDLTLQADGQQPRLLRLIAGQRGKPARCL